MYYEINVALKGSHFFATAKRSITSLDRAKEVFNTLTKKFPVSKGWDVTASRVEETSSSVTRELKSLAQ